MASTFAPSTAQTGSRFTGGYAPSRTYARQDAAGAAVKPMSPPAPPVAAVPDPHRDGHALCDDMCSGHPIDVDNDTPTIVPLTIPTALADDERVQDDAELSDEPEAVEPQPVVSTSSLERLNALPRPSRGKVSDHRPKVQRHPTLDEMVPHPGMPLVWHLAGSEATEDRWSSVIRSDLADGPQDATEPTTLDGAPAGVKSFDWIRAFSREAGLSPRAVAAGHVLADAGSMRGIYSMPREHIAQRLGLSTKPSSMDGSVSLALAELAWAGWIVVTNSSVKGVSPTYRLSLPTWIVGTYLEPR